MNIDLEHYNGKPDNSMLSGIPILRVEFKCRTDLGENVKEKAIKLKNDLNALYPDKKIIIIFTHRSGFEGRYKRWEDFTEHDWFYLTEDWIDTLTPAFQVFAPDPKYIFQIGNEPDHIPNTEHTGASVLIPPKSYGEIFNKSYMLIKYYNKDTTVITAGFKTGAANAYNYFMNARITNYDGFAVHLYGAGAKYNSTFKLANGTNHLENHLEYLTARNVKNIWLTEFGILDNPDASPLLATKYIKDFVDVSLTFPKVKAICYYSWGIKMHNGWGLGTNNSVVHLNAKKALEYSIADYFVEPNFPFVKIFINSARNIRKEPRTKNTDGTSADNIVHLFDQHLKEHIFINEASAEANEGYLWKEVMTIKGYRGWMAFDSKMTRRLK